MNTRKIQKLVKFIQEAPAIYYEPNSANQHMVGYLIEHPGNWPYGHIPQWYVNEAKCKVTHNPNEIVLILSHDLEWTFNITEGMLHNARVSPNGEKLILIDYDTKGKPQKHFLSFPMRITVNKKIK